MKKKDKFHKTFPYYTNIKRHSNIPYMTKNKNHHFFLLKSSSRYITKFLNSTMDKQFISCVCSNSIIWQLFTA